MKTNDGNCEFCGSSQQSLCAYGQSCGRAPSIEESMEVARRVNAAIELIVNYGGIDGAHHKDWVLDQAVRLLADDQYDRIVAEACDGEDGPETYDWETGIAP